MDRLNRILTSVLSESLSIDDRLALAHDIAGKLAHTNKIVGINREDPDNPTPMILFHNYANEEDIDWESLSWRAVYGAIIPSSDHYGISIHDIWIEVPLDNQAAAIYAVRRSLELTNEYNFTAKIDFNPAWTRTAVQQAEAETGKMDQDPFGEVSDDYGYDDEVKFWAEWEGEPVANSKGYIQ